MMDEEIIAILYEHYTGLFPRSGSSCGRVFPTAETERQGITQQELLTSVRDVVRERALPDPGMHPDAP